MRLRYSYQIRAVSREGNKDSDSGRSDQHNRYTAELQFAYEASPRDALARLTGTAVVSVGVSRPWRR